MASNIKITRLEETLPAASTNTKVIRWINILLMTASVYFVGGYMVDFLLIKLQGVDNPPPPMFLTVMKVICYILALIPGSIISSLIKRLFSKELEDKYSHLKIEWDISVDQFLKKYDDLRKRKLLLYGIHIITVLVVCSLLINFLAQKFQNTEPAIQATLIFAGSVFSILFVSIAIAMGRRSIFKTYFKTFKEKLLPEFTDQIIPNLSYEANAGIDQNDFQASELFKGKIGTYEGEDYFKGEVHSLPLEYSNLRVSKMTERRQDNNRRLEFIPLFKGLFAICDCHANIETSIIISSNIARQYMVKTMGKVIEKKIINPDYPGYKAHQLDNEEHAKYLSVFVKDDKPTEQYLTSDFLDQLTPYFKNLPDTRSLSLSINNGKLYIAINDHTGTGSFIDAPVTKYTCTNPVIFKEYVIDLDTVGGIVKVINLFCQYEMKA